MWLSLIELEEIQGDTVLLSVPNKLSLERIEKVYKGIIEESLAKVLNTPISLKLDLRSIEYNKVQLNFEVSEENSQNSRKVNSSSQNSGSTSSLNNISDENIVINPEFSFTSFIIGPSNRFAHAAAMAVAEKPTKAYNPLFIYGDTGLGKTHLLHAIGNYINQHFPNFTIKYVSTETFMNEFVDALRLNTPTAFKRKYRECDVLLIDDIQFMENKDSLQEEFFHTFNSLYEASKQVVISSDRPPKALKTLEHRLISRFSSGLITDIQAPELETRLAILTSKCQRENIEVGYDVLEFIASNIKDNIRELEGALIRVSAYATLYKQECSLETAKNVLSDIVFNGNQRQITVDLIKEITAKQFNLTVEDLCSNSRNRPLVMARHICMYLCKELTDYSYPTIAKEFGGRDHTSVLYAVDKISSLIKQRQAVFEQVNTLILKIKGEGTA
jgi:chromosomal replication initiator protein